MWFGLRDTYSVSMMGRASSNCKMRGDLPGISQPHLETETLTACLLCCIEMAITGWTQEYSFYGSKSDSRKESYSPSPNLHVYVYNNNVTNGWFSRVIRVCVKK